MPELPEVETVRSGLEPVLSGRSFVRVEQRRKDLRFPLPERFAERLTAGACCASAGAPSTSWSISTGTRCLPCISA